MAFIETIPEDSADQEVAALYEADRARLGYVANYTKTFSHRPAVYGAWGGLIGAIRSGMDLRRYELATVAAAGSLRSSYCSLAHGKVLREKFFEPARVRDIAVDHRAADLDPVEVAVMDFAEQVAGDAGEITEEDVDRLRRLGLTDVEILDVTLAAAARCFFSKVLDATGTLADSAYRRLEPELREALTVGRPIAED